MARAISPIHTYTDGDVCFALATGAHGAAATRRRDGFIRPADGTLRPARPVIAAAADAVARAIVHAVLASDLGGHDAELPRPAAVGARRRPEGACLVSENG